MERLDAKPATGGADFFALVEQRASASQTSADRWARYVALKEALLARGVARSDSRILRWAAPILCHSASEFEQIMRLGPVDEPTIRAPDVETEDTPPPPPPWWERYQRQFVGMVAVLTLTLLLVSSQPPQPAGGGGGGQTAQQTQKEVTVDTSPAPDSAEEGLDDPGTEEVIPTFLERLWPFGILAVLVPLLLAAAYIVWLRRRRREIKREFTPPPHDSAQVRFDGNELDLLTEQPLQRALRKLRQHRDAPTSKIDVRATIRATIAAAGLPQIRQATRKQTPEYLVLTEREDPGDHLAMFGRLFSRRLDEEHVATAYYEFRGTPQRLQQVKRGEVAGRTSIHELLAYNPGARSILLQESFDILDGPALPASSAELARMAGAMVMVPRAQEYWDDAEIALSRLGFSVAAPDAANIDRIADHLGEDDAEPRALGAVEGRYDLAEKLAFDRERLLAPESPAPRIVRGLASDLEAWLGPDGSEWLRAIALFPRVDPSLTVYFGKHLPGRDGQPLLSEDSYLRIARLPWLRAASMPDWLRLELVHGLSRERMEQATGVIAAYLLPRVEDADGQLVLDIAAGNDSQHRRRLLEWLRGTPESVLNDAILFDALRGREPEKLAVEASNALVRRLRRLWRQEEVRVAVLALLTAVAIALAWDYFWGDETPEEELSVEAVPPSDPAPNDISGPETQEGPIDAPIEDAEAGIDSDPAPDRQQAVDPGPQVRPDTFPEQNTRSSDQAANGPFVIFATGDHDGPISRENRAYIDQILDGFERQGVALENLQVEVVGEFVGDAAQVSNLQDQVISYLESRGIPEGQIEPDAIGSPRFGGGIAEESLNRLEMTFSVLTGGARPPPEALETEEVYGGIFTRPFETTVYLQRDRQLGLTSTQTAVIDRLYDEYRSFTNRYPCNVEVIGTGTSSSVQASTDGIALIEAYLVELGIPSEAIEIFAHSASDGQPEQDASINQHVPLQGGGSPGGSPAVQISLVLQTPRSESCPEAFRPITGPLQITRPNQQRPPID